MSILPRILELRLSFIWTETFPTLLTGTALQAPMAFLGNHDSYTSEYEKIKQQMSDLIKQQDEQYEQLYSSHDSYDDPKTLAVQEAELKQAFQKQLNNSDILTPPWPWLRRNSIHHFWQYYFENVEPNKLGSAQAWEYLVPLRVHIPVQIKSPWPPDGPKCRVMVDGLFYPHGVAVVIMARILFKRHTDADGTTAGAEEPGLGPTRTMERALQVRKNLTFPVMLLDGTPDNLKLDALATELLNYLRERALGKGSPQGTRPSEPLTVATVIQGRGGDATLPITPNGDLHKVLEGLCSWKDDWAEQQGLKPLADANLLISNSPPGHIVYHLARGRAVWMPKYFALPTRRDEHKLSCYHRNLTLVLLQTEMLAQVNVLCTDYLDRGEMPPPMLQSLARFAAIRLGYLYAALKKGGKKYTYNSASPRLYLQENDYVDLINQVRESFNPKLPPLTYKPR